MKPLAKRCSTVPRSAIRAIVGKSYGMDNVISFGFGQPDFTTPERIIKAGIKSLENGETFYTPNAGCDYLRAAIAEDGRPASRSETSCRSMGRQSKRSGSPSRTIG